MYRVRSNQGVSVGTESKLSLLVVDDESAVRLYLKSILEKSYDVRLASSEAEAFSQLSEQSIDVVLLDLMLGEDQNGLSLIGKIKQKSPDTDVIIISGIKMVQTVVEAMRLGAADYINKPFERDELLLVIGRVLQKRRLEQKNQFLTDQLATVEVGDPILGTSPEIQQVKDTIAKLKGQEVNVLLVGDTGTGKEMFARRLHAQEGGMDRPFVSVNCAAIPENLLESVLFGHEKGAFTGATERRIGKFELAHGGDIFLDEVNTLSLSLQAKLLRVLEEKEVERIGSSTPRKIRFRVISAANESIVRKVAGGEFRSDLFYRLNTVTIQIPTLSQRRGDIVLLAEYFLKKYRRTREPKRLSSEVKEFLENHSWRGNVRELRNTVENMIIFSKSDSIQLEDIPLLRNGESEVMDRRKGPRASEAISETPNLSSAPTPMMGQYDDLVRVYEREILLRRLEKNRWSKTRTCEDLGITRNKLYRKMAELGIEP